MGSTCQLHLPSPSFLYLELPLLSGKLTSRNQHGLGDIARAGSDTARVDTTGGLGVVTMELVEMSLHTDTGLDPFRLALRSEHRLRI